MQCNTQRVYSKRDPFKTLTSTNIARVHHNRSTRVMCAKEFVIDDTTLSCNCKYGVLAFGNDGTGPVDESKRTKRVQGWSRQIMGGRFYCLQYYYFVK